MILKHLPNTLTCLNLVTGALGIMALYQGRLEHAIYYVMIAAGFDFLDGFAARLLHVQSVIGKELDSLADVISFGLLPSLFMVEMLRTSNPDPNWMVYSGLLIAAFSAIRLAKFNVDDRQSDQFIGLPTPANALMLTSITLLPAGWFSTWVLVVLSVLSSLLLVSNLPLIALKFQGVRWKDNQWKYLLLSICLVLLILMGWQALPLLIPCYVLVSVLGNFLTPKGV